MKHGLHMTAERLLEVMDDQQREAVKGKYLEYQKKCMNDSQALKLAVMYVMETDLMRKLIDADHETTIYTDEGQPVDVFADKMVQALQGYRREIRLGLHYEGNSAQNTTDATSSHDNLDALIQDET
jgi:ADP-glucose pyrophosphorylase